MAEPDTAQRDVLLQAQGISKAYEISAAPSQLFFENVFGWKSGREQFHALKPMDISIRRGESVGILGRNGAGKSTLLGVLAGVTSTTTGTITRKARVAALVGIGQSFNIEESGRSNAKRFCRLQGLFGEDAKRAVERIREFAEIGSHFERPVKTYSSGMKARLNFACATCVEADLIIIDEVLAVGDAEFRSKCYGHIEATIESGQTYLMVSHSPAIIGNYCNRALVLNEGEVVFDGDPLGAMQSYESLTNVKARRRRSQDELFALRKAHTGEASEGAPVELTGTELFDLNGSLIDSASMPASETPIRLKATYAVHADIELPRLACGLRNGKGIMVSAVGQTLKDDPWLAGQTRTATFEFIPRLAIGSYLIRLTVHALTRDSKNLVLDREGALELQIVEGVNTGMVDLGFNVADVSVETTDKEPQSAAIG